MRILKKSTDYFGIENILNRYGFVNKKLMIQYFRDNSKSELIKAKPSQHVSPHLLFATYCQFP